MLLLLYRISLCSCWRIHRPEEYGLLLNSDRFVIPKAQGLMLLEHTE